MPKDRTDAAGPPLLVVAGALIDSRGRVLVQQRRAGSAMAGLWEFPGGKLEPGETPEAALVRELAEELGIAVGMGALSPCGFASVPHGERHLLLLLYIAREWTGDPRPLDAAALRWTAPNALHALAMPPADRPLVDMLNAVL